MKHLRWVLLVTLAAPPALADPLLVFAASSTTEAMQELGARYEEETHVRVQFSFGGSSELARQILAGAPADVFLSADDAQMDRLQAAGKVSAADRVELLSNVLAVVQPRGAKKLVEHPADLAGMRLGLADPSSVPAGVYAKQWLETLGVWKDVEPHVVPMLDVRAALAAVEARRVDASIVYATDVRVAKKVRTVPAQTLLSWGKGAMPRIRYPAAAIQRPDAAAARAFVSFLAGPTAQGVFALHGFSPAAGQ